MKELRRRKQQPDDNHGADKSEAGEGRSPTRGGSSQVFGDETLAMVEEESSGTFDEARL